MMISTIYIKKGGMKTDINIGLSGSKLKILPGNIIRKYCPDLGFADRFKIQIDKQILFHSKSVNKQSLFTPYIIKHTSTHFDMQYISGESYQDYFSKCTKEDLDNLYCIYTDYIKNLISSSESYINSDEIQIKLITKLKNLKSSSKYIDYIQFLKNKVKTTQFSKVNKTDYHGDFSVANMIFFKSKVCCIDFLDSYIDTGIVDLVKLQQDLKYGWVLDNNTSNLRIRQSFKYLWDKLYLEFKKYYDLELTKIITILNWLRIEPYISTNKQKLILDKFITNSQYYEEFNNSNSR